MTDYYSTKRVTAFPCSAHNAPQFHGRGIDINQADDPGMAITYADGYRSWCPQPAFDRDYQHVTAMSFGHAIEALKAGHRVARAGWTEKTWLVLIRGTAQAQQSGTPDRIGIVFDERDMQSGWTPSQPDMLATDWTIVTKE